ncbi:MAG: ABC transporter substrate-binding protein [Nitrosospira sp.]|nr:ABC transporter substrate-binding protein [Nitrosospira sp.]MBI0412733.1 ABC transporter substrate-binding protein [Nitrosospira sp.]
MKANNRVSAMLVLMVVLLISIFMAWQYYSSSVPSIKVGILHSLTGPMATREKPLVDALQLAIEEANATGGINGQKIEPVIVDCRSEPLYCGQQAEYLITEAKVKALFGCWTSACRQAVKPVVERHQGLLFYSVQYEGMEQSPNIIYTGATPNQQVAPVVHWALETLDKRDKSNKHVYLVGSDYIFPRVTNLLIKDLLAAQGATVVGERYIPLGSSEVVELVADILQKRPGMILNTLESDSAVAFFRELNRVGITPEKTPVLSFSIAEVDLAGKDTVRMEGHYAAWNYFQSIQTPQNQAFLQRFHNRYGQKMVVDDPMEASYISLQLWVQAAHEAGSAEPSQVKRTILRQSLLAPEGVVSLDSATRHLWRVARIGKARADGQFDIVWDSGRPFEPSPFPTYRTREDWGHLIKAIEGTGL